MRTLLQPGRMRMLSLAPETWRADLLNIVLRVAAALGTLVYIPSVVSAVRFRTTAIFALDTLAIAAVLTLTFSSALSSKLRAIAICLVIYALGAGLMISVGSVSQIYLLGFSLLTTLLLSLNWGLAAVVVNAATMLAIGLMGIASPEMGAARWTGNFLEWPLISANFVLVNVTLVLMLGAVIAALERALVTAGTTHHALCHEQNALVLLNESLQQEIHERALNQEMLRGSRALLRIAGRTARLGGWRVELGCDVVVWSDEACDLHEVPAGTTPTLDEVIAFYLPEWRESMRNAVEQCVSNGTPFDIEAEIQTALTHRLWVRAIGNPHRSDAGVITHIEGSIQNINPQKLADARHRSLEDKFRQAERMETVGSLAGGIAHDFNNLMSVVLGYSELLMTDRAGDDPIRSDLEQIHGAGLRAVELTRQLLAFSRQQMLEPKVVDMGEIVGDLEKMLRRLIGADIDLITSCTSAIGSVLIDPRQLEQVIINLAVNARDAMPSGGMITIQTSQVDLDEHYASNHAGVTAGPHVMLAVSDTGNGMDKATQARMFEPFFTTKEQGKGTGLGLATVFGIVQQSGGTIWVYSEIGVGTSFKLYFPVVAGSPVAAANMALADSSAPHGKETILLVEDEEGVRLLTRMILRRYGYNVLEAQSGGDALLLCEQYPARIHLLLTDVVMPLMSGRVLSERLRSLRPTMKTLYMSGYTDDAVVRHGILDSTTSFIQKPITPNKLGRKVREVLDADVTIYSSSRFQVAPIERRSA